MKSRGRIHMLNICFFMKFVPPTGSRTFGGDSVSLYEEDMNRSKVLVTWSRSRSALFGSISEETRDWHRQMLEIVRPFIYPWHDWHRHIMVCPFWKTSRICDVHTACRGHLKKSNLLSKTICWQIRSCRQDACSAHILRTWKHPASLKFKGLWKNSDSMAVLNMNSPN